MDISTIPLLLQGFVMSVACGGDCLFELSRGDSIRHSPSAACEDPRATFWPLSPREYKTKVENEYYQLFTL